MDKITIDTLISKTELAIVLGVSPRNIRQLTEDGIIPVLDKSKVNLADGVQKYITWKTKKTVSTGSEADAERKKKVADASYKESKAKIASYEAAELEGKMHRAEDVQELTEMMIYNIRSALMALPGRLAVDVVNCHTAAEASDFITKEVHKIMRELAEFEYDPEKYNELVRNRREWAMEESDEE